MKERCCERVYRSGGPFRGSPCSRAGTVERDGEHYCFQHDPGAVAKRREAADAVWKADRDRDIKRDEEARARATELGCGRSEWRKGVRFEATGNLILTPVEVDKLLKRLRLMKEEEE